MTARFVLDESSWKTAFGSTELLQAIDQWIERIEDARKRHQVVKHKEYCHTCVGAGVDLYSVLYEASFHVMLEHDLRWRLGLVLDQIRTFDESELADFDVEINGITRFAPGVAWAHAKCTQNHHVAVLPLSIGVFPQGPTPVSVVGNTSDLFFVTHERHHVDFFRTVIALENANVEQFQHLARSAFPALEWADRLC